MEEEEEKNRKAARKLRFSVKIRGEIVNQNDDGNNGRDNERTIEILYRCVLIGTHRHRAERAERNRCSSSSFVECSSRYSKRGRFCVTFSRKRSMRHFGPSIGQTTGGKFLFFFLFCLLLLPPSFFSFFFFLFFWHLSILRKLSKVCSRRTRGSSVSKSADRYIFFPFVTSFDSLIRYRFSIASQRIFLEDRRVRNSLFSR